MTSRPHSVPARATARRRSGGGRPRARLSDQCVRSAEAEWEFYPPTSDPYIAQELVETLYHVLWESLVHVFFEHRGLLEGRSERRTHDAGASSSCTRSWTSASASSIRCSTTSAARC